MKIAIITGTSSGIGERLLASLLESGYFVFGGSRRPTSIEHPNFIDIELDLRKQSSVEAFFDEVSQKTEVVDVLINNAGICELSYIKDTEPKEVLDNFTTNAFGTYLILKNFEDFIIEGETKIINILSHAGIENNEGTGAYAMAESSKKSLLNVLRKEWDKYDLAITDLHLPAVATSIWANYEDIDTTEMLDADKVSEVVRKVLELNSKIKISNMTLDL